MTLGLLKKPKSINRKGRKAITQRSQRTLHQCLIFVHFMKTFAYFAVKTTFSTASNFILSLYLQAYYY
jgi:hypothetical protein